MGASGAIAGVLGAYLVMFPTARVDSLVTFGFFLTQVRLPALFVIGQWIVLQFLSGFASLGAAHASGGIAYFAHIGGAVAGLLVAAALVRPEKAVGMKVSSVKKKLKEKAFAPGVNRDEVTSVEGSIGLPLDEFLAVGIEGLQSVAGEIQLAP